MNDTMTPPELPDLSEQSIARIESALFDEIAEERPLRAAPAVRSATRRRRWVTGIGVAAAFVAGVLITPGLLNVAGGANSASDAGGSIEPLSGVSLSEAAPADGDAAMESADSSVDMSGSRMPMAEQDESREIIANGYASVRVDDISDAADAIAATADELGGYVESTSIGVEETSTDASMPVVPGGDYGWISIRVPSTELSAVIDDLDDLGVVLSSSISKQDVTSTAIDLRARIDATRASVERLTELMTQSGSVSELIEAEIALTDRQAQLESYEQQLAGLEDQVALSSLQVDLTRQTAATVADPAGFGDGLLAGWNGLVVALNAVVISIGFIIPWIGVAAVVALVVWGVRRWRHRRKNQLVSDSEA